MHIPNLDADQLIALLEAVFGRQPEERALTIFVDLPGPHQPDKPSWKDRRRIALEWFTHLQQRISDLPFTAVNFCAYEDVGSNNSDLPETVILIERTSRDQPSLESQSVLLDHILAGSTIVLSMTEFSATAPLKVLARKHLFRGATLPGFVRQMIPALGLDYEKVNSRVEQIQTRMNRAGSAVLLLRAEGEEFSCTLDLRYRTAHASGGVIRKPGEVANLPSGEAYIVPYEGERSGEPSRTAGRLPVQFGDEIVVFRVQGNRAVQVERSVPQAPRAEAPHGPLDQPLPHAPQAPRAEEPHVPHAPQASRAEEPHVPHAPQASRAEKPPLPQAPRTEEQHAPQAEEQRKLLKAEPAYGNIAELGIGVLGEWGVTAVGSTLLDEKLGLHIAFGRSEHFGGVTGPASFNSPKNVIHIDWVYVPGVQPLIQVRSLVFHYEDNQSEEIMSDTGIRV
jgi:hypothetical protein